MVNPHGIRLSSHELNVHRRRLLKSRSRKGGYVNSCPTLVLNESFDHMGRWNHLVQDRLSLVDLETDSDVWLFLLP